MTEQEMRPAIVIEESPGHADANLTAELDTAIFGDGGAAPSRL